MIVVLPESEGYWLLESVESLFSVTAADAVVVVVVSGGSVGDSGLSKLQAF